MKLRGESGAVPARMGGARTSGGITGLGGARVNPTYKTGTLKEPSKASVKVIDKTKAAATEAAWARLQARNK